VFLNYNLTLENKNFSNIILKIKIYKIFNILFNVCEQSDGERNDDESDEHHLSSWLCERSDDECHHSSWLYERHDGSDERHDGSGEHHQRRLKL
jgi:hypothetical protein